MKSPWSVSLLLALCAGLHPGTSFSAGWDEPEFIDLGWDYYAEYPKAVMDDSGNAFCAFDETDMTPQGPGETHFYVNRYTPAGWNGPMCLDPGPGGITEGWDIACNGAGNAIAVYDYGSGQSGGLYARHFTSGMWGNPVAIPIDVGYQVSRPGVAIGTDGRAVCVFELHDGSGAHLYASHFDGINWGSPVAINTGEGSSHRPRVVMDRFGNAICVFYQIVGEGIYAYATYSCDGEWGGAIAIGPAGSIGGDSPEYPPDIACDSEGNALCAFIVPGYSSDDPCAIYANRFSNGSWEGVIRIDGGPDGAWWFYPDIAVDSGGDALCAFGSDGGAAGGIHVYANRFTSGAWTGPARLDAGIYWESGVEPCVGFDGYGRAVSIFRGGEHVLCQPWSMDVSHIYANYWDSGGWSGAGVIGERGCWTTLFPCLAVSRNGDAVCASMLMNPLGGAESRILAIRYTAPPPPSYDVIRISFGPADAMVPPGYTRDWGQAYGIYRASNYTFGWR